MRTYTTNHPRVRNCEWCDNLLTEGSVVVVEPTRNPKRVRQTFVCHGCAR